MSSVDRSRDSCVGVDHRSPLTQRASTRRKTCSFAATIRDVAAPWQHSETPPQGIAIRVRLVRVRSPGDSQRTRSRRRFIGTRRAPSKKAIPAKPASPANVSHTRCSRTSRATAASRGSYEDERWAPRFALQSKSETVRPSSCHLATRRRIGPSGTLASVHGPWRTRAADAAKVDS